MMPLDDVSQLKLAERIKQAVRRMRTRAWRYPVVLVVAPDLPEMGVAFWQSVARGCQLPCVDLLERAAADAEVQEHAYIWSVFVEWLGEEARRLGGAFFLETDLFTTAWSERERADFFYKLLRLELQDSVSGESLPVVVISRLADQVELPASSSTVGEVLRIPE